LGKLPVEWGEVGFFESTGGDEKVNAEGGIGGAGEGERGQSLKSEE